MYKTVLSHMLYFTVFLTSAVQKSNIDVKTDHAVE